MKFPCVLTFLFLSLITGGISLKSPGTLKLSRDGKEDVAVAKLKEWKALGKKLKDKSITEPDGVCTAEDQLSHDYFLLTDLIYGQRGFGILKWGYPRVTFYDAAFKALGNVSEATVFCEAYLRLTCLGGKCLSCSSLPEEAPQLLKDGCGYNRTGGINAAVDESKIGDIPGPEPLELTDGDCDDDGWFNEYFVVNFVRSFETDKGYAKQTTGEGCTNLVGLQEAFVTGKKLLKDGQVGLKERVDRHLQFYRDTFRLVKRGLSNKVKMCKYARAGDEGPWVCGPDSECVDCFKDDVKMFNAACGWPEDPPGNYTKDCVIATTPVAESTTGRGRKIGGSGWGVSVWLVLVVMLKWLRG